MLRIAANGGTGRRIRQRQTYRNPMTQALECQTLMEREGLTRAALARRLGVSRARVTQILALLRLAPEIQVHLLALPKDNGRRLITERALRKITHAADPTIQVADFEALLQ